MEKKCCCRSSFFSCLACFSGNTHPPVDSGESATNLMDASAHAIPNAQVSPAAPTEEATNPMDASAHAIQVSPAAPTEEADGRRHNPHTVPSASASASASAPPFQAASSSDADCASTSDVPTQHAPASGGPSSHDASSSADYASTSAVPTQDAPASGGPSSSFPTESDIIKKIREAAEVDEKDDNANLEGLIHHISKLLELRKKNELDKKRSTDHHLPKSSGFLKLKEVLSEMIEAASSLKDIIPKSRSLLTGLGQAHWALAGLLVVSYILERFEAVSVNRNECLDLLDEMYRLAKYVKHLKERPRLREGMEDLIQEALETIVEAASMCCVQIPSSKLSRFFSASADKKEILKFQGDLERKYKDMKIRFDICLYDAIDCRKSRQPIPFEREYPDYAVGIEEPLKDVVQLLEWESEKNAVAVIVYGFGGMGKSTLADAVFARLDIVGCKYSMVRLFDYITSTPNIEEKQKCILRDLTMGIAEEKDVRTFEREIRLALEKEIAFIYIDNVLDSDLARDLLQRLLPRDTQMAKKVRVLITARDKSVRTVCRMETKDYAMNVLPSSEAMVLLNKEIKEEELDSSQLNEIMKISVGIPMKLMMIAAFIRTEKDKQKAFRILMEDKEHLKGQAFGNIEHYVFAYDNLPERCKDPFLDICVFFKGMDWDSVADIVGESELDTLEKRALVSKDRGMTLSIHDVILKIGIIRAEETRFNFTNANRGQFEEFLEKDIPGIKGLWFDVYENPSDIPAIKLDSMSNSLKILRLGNLKVKGKCGKRFEKLVFFQGKVPHLPFNISQMSSNLKYMELRGEENFKISTNHLQQLLNDLQQPRNLRILRLIRFEGLKKLPEELGEMLHELRELTLSWCISIEELPKSIANLQYLRVLKMDYSYNLQKLPEELGEKLHELTELSLSYCTSIEELPRSISKLQKLRELRMGHCYSLSWLPEDFGILNSLQVLDLSSCKKLKVLPKDFEKFEKLNPFKDFVSLNSFEFLDAYLRS